MAAGTGVASWMMLGAAQRAIAGTDVVGTGPASGKKKTSTSTSTSTPSVTEYETGKEYAIFVHSEPAKKIISEPCLLFTNVNAPFVSQINAVLQAECSGPGADPPGDAPSKVSVEFSGSSILNFQAGMNGGNPQAGYMVPRDDPGKESKKVEHIEHLVLKIKNQPPLPYAPGTIVAKGFGNVTLEPLQQGSSFSLHAITPGTLTYQASLGAVANDVSISGYRIEQVVTTKTAGGQTSTTTTSSGTVSNTTGHHADVGLNLSKKPSLGLGYKFDYTEAKTSANGSSYSYTGTNGETNTMTLQAVSASLSGTFTWQIAVATRLWKRKKVPVTQAPQPWEPAWADDAPSDGWLIPPPVAPQK